MITARTLFRRLVGLVILPFFPMFVIRDIFFWWPCRRWQSISIHLCVRDAWLLWRDVYWDP